MFKYLNLSILKLLIRRRIVSRAAILSNEKAYGLAKNLSRSLDLEYDVVEQREFPDGEVYVRIPVEVKDRAFILLWSIKGDINNDLMALFYTIDALWDMGASRVISVIPYMPYARQDSRFKSGESISIVALSKILRALTQDYIVTIDMHLHRIGDPKKIFGDRFINLSAVEPIAGYVSKGIALEKDAVVVGPDEESEQWASRLGRLLDLPWFVFEKERLTAEEVKVGAEKSLISGADKAVIIDDIISTGGTVESTVRALRDLGITKVYVYCVHPVLSPTAFYRLASLRLSDLACTNSLPSPISHVDISGVIGDAVKNLL